MANSSPPVKTKKQRKEYSINRSNSFNRSSIPPDSRYQAASRIRGLENYKAGMKAGCAEEGEITGKRGPVQFPGIEAQRRYKRKSFAVIRSSFSLSLLLPRTGRHRSLSLPPPPLSPSPSPRPRPVFVAGREMNGNTASRALESFYRAAQAPGFTTSSSSLGVGWR